MIYFAFNMTFVLVGCWRSNTAPVVWRQIYTRQYVSYGEWQLKWNAHCMNVNLWRVDMKENCLPFLVAFWSYKCRFGRVRTWDRRTGCSSGTIKTTDEGNRFVPIKCPFWIFEQTLSIQRKNFICIIISAMDLIFKRNRDWKYYLVITS